MSELYPPEVLDENEDNGTMVDSLEALRQSVVGHRIVSVENGPSTDMFWGTTMTVLTLDDGTRVKMRGRSDCCAHADVEAFLLHPEMVDHVITGVGTTDGYTTWHIFADYGDILELSVGWSCGNPFYYAYGFDIEIEEIKE